MGGALESVGREVTEWETLSDGIRISFKRRLICPLREDGFPSERPNVVGSTSTRGVLDSAREVV
jgi:hypothetical protein